MPRITVAYPGDPNRLLNLFLPTSPQIIIPTNFDQTIVPTYEFPPVASYFDSAAHRSDTNVGAAGATTVAGSTVPDGFYRYYIAASVEHNDPVGRAIWISIVTGGGAAVGLTAQPFSAAANLKVGVGRSFLLGAGQFLRGEAVAIAAGQVVTLQTYFLELRIAHPHPKV